MSFLLFIPKFLLFYLLHKKHFLGHQLKIYINLLLFFSSSSSVTVGDFLFDIMRFKIKWPPLSRFNNVVSYKFVKSNQTFYCFFHCFLNFLFSFFFLFFSCFFEFLFCCKWRLRVFFLVGLTNIISLSLIFFFLFLFFLSGTILGTSPSIFTFVLVLFFCFCSAFIFLRQVMYLSDKLLFLI